MLSRSSLVLLALLALAWLVVADLRRALAPEVTVILAGPAHGSFDQHARLYQARLQAMGLRAEVRNEDNSLKIIDRLQDAHEGLHIGFTAQRLDQPRNYPDLASAGVIEIQPLFLFVRADAPMPATPAGFHGRRLAMPPPDSATARAARDLLAEYGVTPLNTPFVHRKIEDVAGALRRGEADAAFYMLAPEHPLVRQLATDPALAMYSFGDHLAISRRIDYLKPVVIARGTYDLQNQRPPADVALVGASVDVIVRRDLHPAVLYALLAAMREVHKAQTLTSSAGEYPSLAGSVLEPHPLAADWSKNGTPWLYTHLPPSWAGFVDANSAPALFLLAVVSVFGTISSINTFIDMLAFQLALFVLRRLQAAIDHGLRPGRASRALFRTAEPILSRRGDEDRARSCLERLRPHLQLP